MTSQQDQSGHSRGVKRGYSGLHSINESPSDSNTSLSPTAPPRQGQAPFSLEGQAQFRQPSSSLSPTTQRASPAARPPSASSIMPHIDIDTQSGAHSHAKTSTNKTTAKASRSQSSSAFRNVSACNRCRLRKNRCDQRLPACTPCEKAGVNCVSFDPLLNKEVPRSYVYYLESRTTYLEDLLEKHGIQFLSAEAYALEKRPESEGPVKTESGSPEVIARKTSQETKQAQQESNTEGSNLERLVSEVGMIPVQGASDRAYLGGSSGISFARVVFAAIKSSVTRASSDKSARTSKLEASALGSGSSMRESVFGLQTKPTIKPAPMPNKEIGLKLANLYFQHACPQMPVLHRGQFMDIFNRVYGDKGHNRTPRESYFLNIVFAIGAGTIVDNPPKDDPDYDDPTPAKRAKLLGEQRQPEEYHASAIVHLEGLLSSCASNDCPDGVSGALEELQAVLLLANFALLRPVAPGLWYIVGVAGRLALDLGLHHEDGQDDTAVSPEAIGRRQWVRELRRRLWWCVYSFDRLVSVCVGRPFGFSDQVITTAWPSLLDDKYISPAGEIVPPNNTFAPSSKYVTHHYLRLRLLQSEIMQVLQHVNAQSIHLSKAHAPNEFVYTALPSAFLQPYASFRHWRTHVDGKLYEWMKSAPSRKDTGVDFPPEFFELNYWQAVIMLYRPSLTAPSELTKELDTLDNDDLRPDSSPAATSHLDEQGDEEFVCLKIAEAGQKVLKIYRQLHRMRLVNYTYLSSHALFMAGISFLYAIWHSPVVRGHLSLDDVDFTVLAATSVLTDMIDNCPPAESCKDAFDRMSKATIQMVMSTTGFGSSAREHIRRKQAATQAGTSQAMPPTLQRASSSTADVRQAMNAATIGYSQQNKVPRFDMHLTDLFSEAESKSQVFNRPSLGLQFRKPRVPTGQANFVPQQSMPSYAGMTPQQRGTGVYQQSNMTPLSQVYTPMTSSQGSTRPQSAASNQAYSVPIQQSHQSSQSPPQTRQQTFRPPSVSTPDSSSFMPSIPTEMLASVDTDAIMGDSTFGVDFNFEDFNDTSIDFNVINGMLGGGTSMFDGGRGGLEQWDDGSWAMLNNAMGDGDGDASGESGGNGSGNSSSQGMDMFGGLFFGGS